MIVRCSIVAIPVYVKHQMSFREGSAGRLDLTVGPKQTMGKTVCVTDSLVLGLKKYRSLYYYVWLFPGRKSSR